MFRPVNWTVKPLLEKLSRGTTTSDTWTYRYTERGSSDELARSVHKRIVEQEEEFITQEVIKALEQKGYTVTKNENTD